MELTLTDDHMMVLGLFRFRMADDAGDVARLLGLEVARADRLLDELVASGLLRVRRIDA